MPAYLKDLLKILLFFGVGFFILYLVYNNQNAAFQEQCRLDGVAAADCSLLDKVWSDLRTVNPLWLLAVLLCFNISNISRALRWRMMLESLGYKTRMLNAFFTIMLSYFANLGLPRIGEVVRATTFSRYEKIRVEKLMGTIVLDRILDLISAGIVFLIAILTEYEMLWSFITQSRASGEDGSGGIVQWLVLAAGLAVAAGVLFYLFRQYFGRFRIVQKIQSLLLGFAEGLRSISRIKRPLPFIFHSLMIWVMYFLMTYLCFSAFGPTEHLGVKAGLIVFAFSTVGVIIPSPGGMGTFHALAVIALGLYGITGGDAFSFANILFFSVQIGASVLLGIISLIMLPVFNKGYHPQRAGAIFTEDETGLSLENKG